MGLMEDLREKLKVKKDIYVGNGLKELNKMNFHGTLTMLIIIYAFFLFQYLTGQKIINYFVPFTIMNIVVHGISSYVYFKKQDSVHYKKFMMISFFLTYGWILFAYENKIVCLLIIPALVMSIMYHDVTFSVVTGIITMLYNISFAVFMSYLNGFDVLTNTDGIFQVLMMLLLVEATIYATFLYSDSYNKNKEYFDMLTAKTQQLSSLTEQTIETLSSAIDAKDHYTEGHSIRVSQYAVEIAKNMGIDGEELDYIKYAGLLHDVGKISVPDRVLNKPERLSDEEFDEMKGHTSAGGDILGVISNLPEISYSALYHHEKFDGTGYPRGLKGEEIPKSARIIALADAYDAMTSDRVYRKRLDEAKVLSEIEKFSGTQFDPKVVAAFMEYVKNRDINQDNCSA